MIVSPRHPFGLVLAVTSVLVFAYLLLPLAVIVGSAFGDTGYLAFPPHGLTFKWYRAALANPRFVNGFLVSIRVGAIVAAVSVVIGVAAAYAIVRRPFRGATLLEALFLSPLLLPTLVLAVALSIFFSKQRFILGTDRLVLAHIAICVPYVLRVTIPVLRRFDATLEEAAMNLGASPRATFFLVTLPVIQPGVIVGATLAFIMSFDEIDLAIFLASPREPTLPVTIYSAVQLGFEPSLAAVSALLILFTAFAMALFQFVIGPKGRCMTVELELRDVARHYGPTVAVDGVSLSVEKGELVALLGPSGCGKTTTLRMVAGFVEPTRGSIHLRGQDVTRLSPHKRDTGMVFQSYALFPHLSAAENIAFGLQRRGVPRAEIAQRVERMLTLLKLDGLARRLPRELSGGQQQRVAVGRALVINPAVVLLDEPFSNLDAQLREGTRIELRRIQQELGLTALFVTHDQAEAMSISDRVAIMHQGRIEQVDTPRNVYTRPASRFIASFVGKANILEGRLVSRGPSGALYDSGGLRLLASDADDTHEGAIVLRPELIRLHHPGTSLTGPNTVQGTVGTVSYSGPVAQLEIALGGDRTLFAEGPGSLPLDFPPGSPVVLDWRPEDLVVCTR